MTTVPARAWPAVSLITLNWNQRAETLDFLAACRRLHYPHLSITVVDNGSVDDSVAAIRAAYPPVQVLSNPRNLGFAAGMNVGIRQALGQGADFVFLANNDTWMASDMLQQLVTAAVEHDAAVLAPLVFYADKPARVWSLGGWRHPVTLDVTRRVWGGQTPIPVDFVPACGLLLRRECLEQVGLLDERYFIYYEDMDYCLRAQRAGFRVLAVPAAHMWHRVSRAMGGADSPQERYHMARSSVLYYRRHVTGWRWLVVLPWRLASVLKTTLRLWRQNPAAARAYWRGLRAGYRWPRLDAS